MAVPLPELGPGAGFHQLVERASDLILIVRDGRVAYSNPAACAALGCAAEELAGRPALDLVHPEDRGRIAARLERLVHDTINPPAEVRLLRSDGSSLPVESISFSSEFELKPASVFMGRDLRPRRDAELLRRRRLDESRAMMDALAVPVLVHRDAVIAYANHRAAQVLRLPGPAALVGRPVWELVPPEGRAELLAGLQPPESSERPQVELRTLRGDGTVGLVQAFGVGAEFEGQPARLVAFHDLTERHEAEERLRMLFDASTAAIVTLDLEGTVQTWNPAARRLFRWSSPEEAAAQRPPHTQPGRDFFAAAVQATAGGRRAEVDVDVDPGPDGGPMRLHMISAPLRDAWGAAIGWIVTVRDTTAARRAEEALRRTHAASELGTLISGVAHEVRNPLFGIGAILEVLASRLPGDSPQEPFLAAIRGELTRLDDLMAHLLELARPAPAELERFPVAYPVEAALRSCKGAAALAAVSLEPALDADAEVAMEAPRLQLAFRHLIDNALHHSPPGSAVRVESRLARTGGQAAVSVRVVDGGPGFRPEDLRRIFQPFFTRRRGGTGLGLAIVQRIVELHGGTVQASNAPEGGAAITVTLPVVAAEGAP